MDINDLLAFRQNTSMLRLLRRQIDSPLGIIPFVGAGMSVPLGLPTWTGFLLEQAELWGVAAAVTDCVERGQFEEAADNIRLACGDLRFNDSVSTQFDWSLDRSHPADIAVFRIPLLASGPVLTTNFDTVLEQAFQNVSREFDRVILGRRVDDALDQISLHRRLLIKLHGEAAFPQDRVLTLSEYISAYGSDGATVDLSLPLPALLHIVLQSRPLLFLGCSLKQDRTMQVIRSVAGAVEKLAHFAVVPAPPAVSDLLARDKFLSEHQIRPIWYPDGEHDSVRILLDFILAPQSHSAHRAGVDSPHPLGGLPDPLDQLRIELFSAGYDLRALGITRAEALRSSRNSSIYRVSSFTSSKVIKLTSNKVANAAALRQIKGTRIQFNEHGLLAAIATPLWTGVTDKDVIEVLPYYEGISLEQIGLRSPSPFRGDLLAQIFNALVRCAHSLHELGVLHRDITPSNVLLSIERGRVEIALVDNSFACLAEGPQKTPTATGDYTAPEQAAGVASPASDFYSIAATCFFLANGSPPFPRDTVAFRSGVRAIDFGDYDARDFEGNEDDYFTGESSTTEALITALLDPDPTGRPSPYWRMLLGTPSRAVGFGRPVIGVLDFGKYGLATIDERGRYEVIPSASVSVTVAELLKADLVRDPKLAKLLHERGIAADRES